MGRLLAFIILAIIAGIIALLKNVLGQFFGNKHLKNASLKSETRNVMNKTAKGISWMEEQWEKSKKDADSHK